MTLVRQQYPTYLIKCTLHTCHNYKNVIQHVLQFGFFKYYKLNISPKSHVINLRRPNWNPQIGQITH